MDGEFNADGNNSQNMAENLQNSQAAALEDSMSAQKPKMKQILEACKDKIAEKNLEIEILKEEMAILKEDNKKLQNENRALRDRNSSSRGRNEPVNSPMPIHNSSVQLDYSFDPVKKKLENEFTDDKECCDLAAMKNNKMNLKNLNPKLELSLDGLIVTYPTVEDADRKQKYTRNEWCTVRAVFPVQFINKIGKRRYIASYYEVKIRHLKFPDCTNEVSIGYCGLHFPSKGISVGEGANSFGIQCIGTIFVDRCEFRFGIENMENQCTKKFNRNDIIGSGLRCSSTNDSVEYFCTLNGELLVTYELPEPEKFTDPNHPIFPAISLQFPDSGVSFNFGQNKWQFNPIKLV